MITIHEAKRIVEGRVEQLGNETVPLSEAVGRILADDVSADRDLPPFDRSQMDGFAVKAKDTSDPPAELQIAGVSAAGSGWHNVLRDGQAVRIMTGAPVPEGADSVQKVELTEESDGVVRILKQAAPGLNIVRKAAEIRKGDRVFARGDRITKTMIASLASFGLANVPVSKRPRLKILSTGSEIVEVGTVPGPDQIRNSNSSMLAAFAEEFAEVELLPSAVDDPDGLAKAIEEALERCDCLIISGGVSVGDFDFTKPVLGRLGAEIFFEKISLKPGKPTVFARRRNVFIFGLPGNPVSIAVTFFVFVRMALLLMQGAAEFDLPSGRAVLSHSIKGAKGRDSMLPVKLSQDISGRTLIKSLKFSGSSNFVAFANANAFVFVPADKDLEEGETAEIFYF